MSKSTWILLTARVHQQEYVYSAVGVYLAAGGLPRKGMVYLANGVYPAKIQEVHPAKKGRGTPRRRASVTDCKGWNPQGITLVSRKVILALGRKGAEGLLD